MLTNNQQQKIDSFMATDMWAMIKSALPDALIGRMKENFNNILFSVAVAPYVTLEFFIPLTGFGRWKIRKILQLTGDMSLKESWIWEGEPPLDDEGFPDLAFMKVLIQNWRAAG